LGKIELDILRRGATTAKPSKTSPPPPPTLLEINNVYKRKIKSGIQHQHKS